MITLRPIFGAALVLVLAVGAGSGCSKASRKARLLDRANQYFKAEQFEKAEIEYLAVLQRFPLEPNAIRQLGLVYCQEGRIQRAFPFLKKSVELQPENVEVRLRLAQACAAGNDPKGARENALWVLGKQPEEEVLLLLADLSAKSNEVQEARQLITSLQQKDQDKPGYHVALSWLALKQTNRAEATTEIEKALALDSKSSAAHLALGTVRLVSNDVTNALAEFKAAAELAPVSSGRWLKYADLQVRIGARDEARRTLEELTQKAPYYLPAWSALMMVQFGQGKYDDCARSINKVLARDPNNFGALLMGGRLMLAKRDSTNAVAHFERMLLTYDRVPSLHYQLALAQLLGNDVDKAMAHLNRAVVLSTDFVEATLLLAGLDIRKGDAESAVALLRPVVKDQPQIPQAHLQLATAYRMQRRPDEAIAVYEQMTRFFPKYPAPLVLMGAVLEQQNRLADARKAFERALALSPDYLPALEQLVNIDLAEQQYTAASDRIRKEIEKRPAAGEPNFLLAEVYLAQGQTNQAESTLLKAIKLNPDLGVAYRVLAKVYRASNKDAQALEQLAEHLARTNDVVALLQSALIHEELKEFSPARDEYERLLKISPANAIALNNLAYLYSERFRQPDKAASFAEKARQLSPEDPNVLDTLGWVLYQKGDFSRALPLLEESAVKLPTKPEIQFHLGMTHYALGEEAPARLALQTAVAAKKEFPGLDEAKRKLAFLTDRGESATPNHIADLEAQARQHPNDTIVQERLADAYAGAADQAATSALSAVPRREVAYDLAGAADKAATAYEKVLKLNPNNVEVMGKLADLYARRLNNQERALELAKEAHRIAPEDPRISQILGRLAYAKGDYKWAFNLLSECTPKLPAEASALYDLAWSQYSMGKVSEAQVTLRRALQIGAEFSQQADAERFLALIGAAENSTKARQAAPQIDAALRLDGSYVPALVASARLAEDGRDFKKSAELYEKVLGRFPEFVPAQKELALIYAGDLAQESKAYSLAVKARQALPGDPDLAKALGMICFHRGEYSQSAQLLKEAAQQRSSDAELLYYLGIAHYRLKQRSESKEALQRALALDGQAKFAEDAKRVVAELK